MTREVLRPMSFGDLLDETFDLYKKHFLLFVGISALLYMPFFLVTYSLKAGTPRTISLSMVIPVAYIVSAASTWAVSHAYFGDTATVLSSYQAVSRKLWRLVLTGLLAGLLAGLLVLAGYVMQVAVGIGIFAAGDRIFNVMGSVIAMISAILTCLLGLLLLIWLVLSSKVAMLEEKSPMANISRWKYLASGNYGRIFITGFLTYLLWFTVQLVLTAPFGGLKMIKGDFSTIGPLYGLSSGVAIALTAPIMEISFVLLYYDIRVRKEGFDLELLARSMGGNLSEAIDLPEEQVEA